MYPGPSTSREHALAEAMDCSTASASFGPRPGLPRRSAATLASHVRRPRERVCLQGKDSAPTLGLRVFVAGGGARPPAVERDFGVFEVQHSLFNGEHSRLGDKTTRPRGPAVAIPLGARVHARGRQGVHRRPGRQGPAMSGQPLRKPNEDGEEAPIARPPCRRRSVRARERRSDRLLRMPSLRVRAHAELTYPYSAGVTTSRLRHVREPLSHLQMRAVPFREELRSVMGWARGALPPGPSGRLRPRHHSSQGPRRQLPATAGSSEACAP